MRHAFCLYALWLTPLCWLAACQSLPASDAPAPHAAPQAMACPTGLAAATSCLSGTDSEGAHYVIAVPAVWSGVLVLHAHGGPELGAPKLERSVEDLKRWSVMVKAGHAWAGSTFRQSGVVVRAAAEDTERLRRIFVQHVAQPQRTVLHGQSWGAGVAAIAAEMYAGTGQPKPAYDAVLLSSGLLAGGTRAYDVRLDLRVVYQWLCKNHPRPDEAQYPLWMGLPAGAHLSRSELAARADECLGLRQPAAERSAEQQARVRTIVQVVRIPERSIQGHLNWATWHFQDIVQRRTGGLNPFGNTGALYAGSTDDAALNAGVLRYRADPEGVRRFGADTDPNGRIGVPVLSVHGINDPTVFVEVDSVFQATMARAGTAGHLVQTFTDDNEHSYLSDPVYPTLVEALLQWVGQGVKPTPAGIAARCPQLEAAFGPGCRFLPGYRPAALDERTAARQRP